MAELNQKAFLFIALAAFLSPALSASHTIGEAGINTNLNGDEWQSVSLDSSLYDNTPLVFATTQTTFGGQDPSSAHVRSVSTTGFETQHCEYDSYACDGHNEEDNAWLAVDPVKARNSVGMDAGTVSISGNNAVTVNFDEDTFDTAPLVFAQVQTNNGNLPVNAPVLTKDASSAEIKLCEQNAQDSCNSGHTTETVAWFAIDLYEADRISGWGANTVSVTDSNWEYVSFEEGFSSTPGVIVSAQDDGGQEDLQPEADNVGTSGADIRYCESDGGDSCGGHATETMAYLAVSTGQLSANKHVCDTDDMEVTLRAPDDSTTQSYTSLSHSSSSGFCGETPQVTETWSQNTGYDFCPQQGDYDGMVSAHTLDEDSSYSWESSTYTSSIYNVNYDSDSAWCNCGDQYSGNTFNWLASATDYNDASYARCCGDESGEIWEASGTGNSACVKSETVGSGTVSSTDPSYLAKDGELHYCKKPGGASKPYSWLTEWYECDYVSTSSGNYYCGAGGTSNAGEWHTLSNSGCQLIERIRGGRIIVK